MRTVTVSVFAVLSVGCGNDEIEVKKPLPIEQVPPQILKVAQDRYPNLKFSTAWTEVEDGQSVYELKGQYPNGKILEVEVTTEGKLLEQTAKP